MLAGHQSVYPTHGIRSHAVTSAGRNTYESDENGNQTTRVYGPDTYKQIYDAENRMTEVKKNGVTMAQFTYNGDGQRVKSVVNGETIQFVNNYYEKKGSEITKYCYAGASQVAVRKYTVPENTTLHYMIGNHLGSASVVMDDAGTFISETRYKPWGEVRYTTANKTLPTRYTFTGQYSYINDDATDLGAAGFGLMFYNARWYDPYQRKREWKHCLANDPKSLHIALAIKGDSNSCLHFGDSL